MAEETAEYYTRRAAAELELAEQSTIPAVTAAHYKLANAFLERAEALKNDKPAPKQTSPS